MFKFFKRKSAQPKIVYPKVDPFAVPHSDTKLIKQALDLAILPDDKVTLKLTTERTIAVIYEGKSWPVPRNISQMVADAFGLRLLSDGIVGNMLSLVMPLCECCRCLDEVTIR